MQEFFILANSEADLVKFIFVGIWLLVVFGGVIFKMIGLNNKDASASPKRNLNNEDMENAKRRLQEMMRERNGQSLNPSFPKVEKPVFYEEEIPSGKPFAQAKKLPPKMEDKSNAYHQSSFDYNAELKAHELALEKSGIDSNSFISKSAKEKTLDSNAIKLGEIKDFVHNKDLLKKSIVVSEILDKPLSLR